MYYTLYYHICCPISYLKELLLMCTYRFSAMHWKLNSVLTTNCICLSEPKHSKIQPITGESTCYLALLKHFHVLILHNYLRPIILLKLFLQSNTERNIQLHSQIKDINRALNFVRPRTKAQPSGKDVRIVHLRLGSSSFLPHPFQFNDH